MGTKNLHQLECLPEEQCCSLFQKIVFEECNVAGNVRASLEKTGREIVGKCKGLPLAVKAMAGLLRGNEDVNIWKRILKNEIWEAEKGTAQTEKPLVLPALKLSYDHLPSHLKQCFAYCYIFPKAYVFDKIELVKVWKAQSFVQSSGQDTIDEVGGDYFDELLMRSFFQVFKIDDKKRYRMHDLIHELAQSVSSPYCCQVKANEPCHVSDRSRHVALLRNNAEQAALEVIGKSKKLRTFLFPGEHLKSFGQALDKIFHSMKYMRLLDLSSSTMLELPESVKEMKLLRYLYLSQTEIRKLPKSICSLYHLQTLKLLGCLWLFELPKDLGNLTNLQHLELDEMFWYKSSTLPPRMGSLTNLQNLHVFHIGPESGYGIDELKGMIYLKGTLRISKLEHAVNAEAAKLKEKEGLEKVVFEWSDTDGRPRDEAADEGVLEDLQPHSNLKELQIFHYKGTRFPSWIRDGLLQNIGTISISHCTRCKILSLGEMPRLGNLYIKGMQNLEEWPEVQYPSLHKLKISSCPKLKELP
ncbi:putative disease resistance RPP13-like protein 1 [Cornus florida]|uniref:putative disease resistance RPP13-like protein 1 n=1 Tax=Cornus florida TaxID=4283 RepID=UPI0028975C1E|nr:putative disease resistance RPP13-like protein 1 [Cornus florida]